MKQSHADVQDHYSEEEAQRKQEERSQELLEDGPFVYHLWDYKNQRGPGETLTILEKTVDIRRLDTSAEIVQVAQFGSAHNEDELNPNFNLSDVDQLAENYTNRSNLDIESHLQFDIDLAQRGDIRMTEGFEKQIEEALDWADGVEGRYLFKCSVVESMDGNPCFVQSVLDLSDTDELELVQWYKQDDVYSYDEIRTEIEEVPDRIYEELDDETAETVEDQVMINKI